jgi:hypothetical protein
MSVDSAFWRKLRADFEGLRDHHFSLTWYSSPDLDPRDGSPSESHWSWSKYLDESLRARLSAFALNGARALGYDSEDAWYDQLRSSEFVRFRATGYLRGEVVAGVFVDSKFGLIHDVAKESATLCCMLETGGCQTVTSGSVTLPAKSQQLQMSAAPTAVLPRDHIGSSATNATPKIAQCAARALEGTDFSQVSDAAQVIFDAISVPVVALNPDEITSDHSLNRTKQESYAPSPQQARGMEVLASVRDEQQCIAADGAVAITSCASTDAPPRKPRTPEVAISQDDSESAGRRKPKRKSLNSAQLNSTRTAKEAREQTGRASLRSKWLDQNMNKKCWTADAEISANGGPVYNTIRRYRSGKPSTRDRYVRHRLAGAFGCEISSVPE